MRAGEHQRQSPVGQRTLVRALLGEEAQRRLRLDRSAPSSRAVDKAPARDDNQPALGIGRRAVQRPGLQGRREGVGERVLGRRHVARVRREKGYEPAVALSRDALGERARGGCHIGQTGLTSIAPIAVPGQREAQAIAASRSGVSIM